MIWTKIEVIRNSIHFIQNNAGKNFKMKMSLVISRSGRQFHLMFKVFANLLSLVHFNLSGQID